MSDRWSLRNLFRTVSHRQLTTLVNAYADATAAAWGTPAKMKIDLYRAPKTFTTFMLDRETMEDMKRRNDRLKIKSADNIGDISAADWEQAAYAEVRLDPVDRNGSDSLKHAWAVAEFKGHFANGASFYTSADLQNVARATKRAQPFMLVGNGWKEHGEQDMGGFIEVGARMGVPSDTMARMMSRRR